VRPLATHALLVALLAACAPARLFPGPPPPPPHRTLQVSPQSLALNGGLSYFPSPAVVSVASDRGFGTPTVSNPGPLIVTSTNPVLVGAWAQQPAPGATTASISVIPIGGTASPVTVTVYDLLGDIGTFTVTSALCGRPDLLDFAQLLYPPPGAHGVSTSTSRIYVSGSSPAWVSSPGPYAPPGKLHVVVDNASTVEGTTLAYATPPPGSATPAPLANSNTYFGSSPLPTLTTNNKYDVYLYDDACEQPFLAGSFST